MLVEITAAGAARDLELLHRGLRTADQCVILPERLMLRQDPAGGSVTARLHLVDFRIIAILARQFGQHLEGFDMRIAPLQRFGERGLQVPRLRVLQDRRTQHRHRAGGVATAQAHARGEGFDHRMHRRLRQRRERRRRPLEVARLQQGLGMAIAGRDLIAIGLVRQLRGEEPQRVAHAVDRTVGAGAQLRAHQVK